MVAPHCRADQAAWKIDKTPHLHSIWLVPETKSDQVLRHWVDRLARQSGAPTFAPHVTLLGDIHGDVHRTEAIYRQYFAGFGPIQAKANNVKTSETFFMSLYLDLSLAQEVHARRTQVIRALDLPISVTDFNPHISLAYGFGAAARNELQFQARGLGTQDYTLSHAVIVKSAKSIPIDSWAEISSITL